MNTGFSTGKAWNWPGELNISSQRLPNTRHPVDKGNDPQEHERGCYSLQSCIHPGYLRSTERRWDFTKQEG
jgi:hypothetical protein